MSERGIGFIDGCGRFSWLVSGVAAILALPVLMASAPAAAIEILSAERFIRTSADYYLDSSYWYTFDNDYDADNFAGAGVWDISLGSRVYSNEQAPDGIGRVDLASNVSANEIAFSSRLLSQGGEYSVEGGDPEDVGSYYYTYEQSWGDAHSELYVRFQVDRATPFSAAFGGVGRPADEVADLYISLTREWLLPIPTPILQSYVFDRTSILHDYAGGTARTNGMLEPGWIYSLSIQHDSVERDDMAFDFLLVVPEPGTGLLLGLGLAGLAAMRRRG